MDGTPPPLPNKTPTGNVLQHILFYQNLLKHLGTFEETVKMQIPAPNLNIETCENDMLPKEIQSQQLHSQHSPSNK